MIHRKQLFTAVLLAAASAIAWSAFYFLRCEASSPINFNVFAFAIVVQFVGILFIASQVVEPWSWALQPSRRWLLVVGVALFLSSIVMARYALNYSDAIGQPNWYKSVGLRCNAP